MLSIFLLIVCSLFFPGIILRVKSITSGRKGPGILQPMQEILKLLKKGTIYSSTTSFIFRIAPVVYFASIVSVIFLLPFGNQTAVIAFPGDFIFFSYLLALGKFFMIIGAMDTGSSFEGMGASREALYSMLVEPAFFILMASFALLTGFTSFSEIYNSLYFNTYITVFMGLLAAITLFQVAMVENSRMPYDDPKTHLELTMIHEVMVLDNSGFDLGLIQYASSLKFVIFGSLISNLFLTPQMPLILCILIFIGVQMLFAIAVGLMESFRARFMLRNNNKAILILISIAMLVFFGVLLIVTNQY
ncbi:MAG: NADH-quinone oxidoreductase subunit H [Lentimicrobiaceae bacterium]|nr:NADH-quinone oxidoreductase subunit H [Lentimicrobiaceae bacterium]